LHPIWQIPSASRAFPSSRNCGPQSETEELILEAELLPWCNGPALAQQLVEHLLVKLPGSFLIGIGQGGTARSVFYTEMLELAKAACETTADLPQ